MSLVCLIVFLISRDLRKVGIVFKRVIVVGDVHGCIQELELLMEKVQPTHDDHIIFVGDLINKGPSSSKVIDLVQSIRRNTCKVSILLGNHEEKFLRWIKYQNRNQHSGMANPMTDHAGIMAKLASELSDDQVDTLASALLWARISGPTFLPEILIVQAGIEPCLE